MLLGRLDNPINLIYREYTQQKNDYFLWKGTSN